MCVCVCVCVRPSVCLSPASEKALLRDSSPASGTDRDSPEPLLKADPDHKELDSKSPDEIILEEWQDGRLLRSARTEEKLTW